MFGERFTKAHIACEGAEINLVHGGDGPPLLLLHGYPQTHVMWHAVAPRLAEHFHVVCPDLRGYGDSSKPPSVVGHATYSKRAMARDMVELMAALGYEHFRVAGHDRGARVAHRLALDHADAVTSLCVMDIAPTRHMYRHTDKEFATAYYHWFFLIQPEGLPERLIGADPAFYLTEKLKRWSAPGAVFNELAVTEYVRCFSHSDVVHASCEDYRAAASIDLVHDDESFGSKLQMPVLALWGSQGFVHRHYDVLAVWREYAEQVTGTCVDAGHFLPEEAPDAVYDELMHFFGSTKEHG